MHQCMQCMHSESREQKSEENPKPLVSEVGEGKAMKQAEKPLPNLQSPSDSAEGWSSQVEPKIKRLCDQVLQTDAAH